MKRTMFRAWDTSRKEWHYFVIKPTPENIDYTISFGSPIHKDLVPLLDDNSWGEFTGLKDKNGKEIYEGDIVHLGGDGSIYDETGNWWSASGPAGYAHPEQAVVWNAEYAGFAPFCIYDCDCGVYMDASKTEVIGNVYENPELLQRGE